MPRAQADQHEHTEAVGPVFHLAQGWPGVRTRGRAVLEAGFTDEAQMGNEMWGLFCLHKCICSLIDAVRCWVLAGR